MRGRSTFVYAGLAMAICILAAGFYRAADHLGSASKPTQAEYRESVLWHAAQIDYELFKLIEGVDDYYRHGGDERRGRMIELFDIFWSRMASADTGPVWRTYMSLDSAAPTIARARNALQRIEPDLLTMGKGDGARRDRVRDALIELAPSFHEITIQANEVRNLQVYTLYERLAAVRRDLLLFFAGVLFGAAILVALILREKRETEGLRRGLEQRVEERTAELRQEVQDRRQAEETLEKNRALLDGLVNNTPNAIILKDAEGRYLFVNERFEEWYGVPASEIIGKTVYDIFPQAAADTYFATDREVLESGKIIARECDVTFPNGVVRTISAVRFPVCDVEGRAINVGTIISDLTVQRRVEAQLQQAQKMEAVGQLTGGVAHDFNNLLAVVLGNLELAEEELQPESRLHGYVAKAIQAGERGAALTQRLLAFSRRQSLQPKPVHPGRLAKGMGELLMRTLGETIKMSLRSEPDLWHCLVDQAQLENALLNLAINARDAMPYGGELIVEAANVHLEAEAGLPTTELNPGDYVLLSISDTGTGMTREVLNSVFEPFFTTKEVGKGSGLGLSMVFGFAKQSGGDVTIDSTPGLGTVVRLYLPRAQETALPELRSVGTFDELGGAGESVLVVEDDADVRQLAVTLLDDLGYRVIAAESGPMALEAVNGSVHIDVLLTDIVLPDGMAGPELARLIVRDHPSAKVLFMSGYSADALDGDGKGSAEQILLRKPFRKAELARALRQVLGPLDQPDSAGSIPKPPLEPAQMAHGGSLAEPDIPSSQPATVLRES